MYLISDGDENVEIAKIRMRIGITRREREGSKLPGYIFAHLYVGVRQMIVLGDEKCDDIRQFLPDRRVS